MTSIRADLKPKIPQICSVRVGFAVPPAQSLVPTHEFSGSKLFLRQTERQLPRV